MNHRVKRVALKSGIAGSTVALAAIIGLLNGSNVYAATPPTQEVTVAGCEANYNRFDQRAAYAICDKEAGANNILTVTCTGNYVEQARIDQNFEFSQYYGEVRCPGESLVTHIKVSAV